MSEPDWAVAWAGQRPHRFRMLARKIRTLVGGASPLRAIEKRLVQRRLPPQPPPIFIVGSPRTGSTVLYQLLAYYYRIGYFTNMSSFFFGAPVTITAITKKLFQPYDDASLHNEYGLARGLWAPSEAGAVRVAWFEPANGIPLEPGEIERTFAALSSYCSGPFVWKNLNNSFHLESLFAACPDALFVRVERDLAFTCQSNVVALAHNSGIGNVYGLRDVDLDPRADLMQQVVSVIVGIEQRLDRFFRHGLGRTHSISYRGLCTDHPRELEALAHTYSGCGYSLAQRRPFRALPLSSSERVSLSRSEWNRLHRLLDAATTAN